MCAASRAGRDQDVSATSLHPRPRPVPVRTIIATIGLVLLTALALLLLYDVRRVLVWIVVAVFFTVALYPVVDWVERTPGGHRTSATLLVFLVGVLILAGLLTLFVVPLVREGAQLRHPAARPRRPTRAGRGPIGSLLERTHALAYVQRHESRSRARISGLAGSATAVLSGHRHRGRRGGDRLRARRADGARGTEGRLRPAQPRRGRRTAASGSAGSAPTARSRSPVTSPATC